jgi:hypothetical protein
MRPSQIIRSGIAAAVLVLLSAACTSTSSSSPASPSGSSTVESPGNLPTEPATGTESPKSPTGGPPSLSLAPGPTGDKDDDGQCFRIHWLGNPIPHGDVFTVNLIVVDLPLTFDQATTANCPGQSCLGYQFSAANDTHNGNDEAFCKVGIGYTGGSIDPNSTNEVDRTMELHGQFACPNVGLTTCQHDAVAVNVHRQGVGSIPITTFVTKATPSGSPSSSPENPPSSPVTSGSSPAAAGSP